MASDLRVASVPRARARRDSLLSRCAILPRTSGPSQRSFKARRSSHSLDHAGGRGKMCASRIRLAARSHRRRATRHPVAPVSANGGGDRCRR